MPAKCLYVFAVYPLIPLTLPRRILMKTVFGVLSDPETPINSPSKKEVKVFSRVIKKTFFNWSKGTTRGEGDHH